jgi:putative inorganic carbon (hco3(-)) transporter
MKYQREIYSPEQSTKEATPKLSYSIIILLYAVVPVFTPNFSTIDSNGPKFLALAVLNLLSYLYLLSQKDLKTNQTGQNEFFTKSFGFLYVLFLIFSLLSFIKSINILESIMQFAKTFTVFSSVFILFIFIKTDKRFLRQLMVILLLVLLIDCLSVFYNIYLFVIGSLKKIDEVKSIYSNKNILASAIFVKIPIAIWFHLYGQGNWKRVGLVILLFAFLGILFISARAFYVGLILLTLVYLIFIGIRYIQTRDRNFIKIFIQYSAALLIAVLIFSLIQATLYPSKKGQFETNISERMKSITGDIGSSGRIPFWLNTLELIKENPLMGVGTGNWKIAELKMENQMITSYIYMYKCHNDFLEITSETGLLGAITFIWLFLFPVLLFVKKIMNKANDDVYQYLLVPVFGILCYGVDAFFNFPSDRPEIQGLFAIYLAANLCFFPVNLYKNRPSRNFRIFYSVLFILLMSFCVYILVNNFISFRYQRIVYEEIKIKKLKHNSTYICNGLPFIPSITAIGEPITVVKARYLFNDQKYEQVISVLKNDKSSPYDGRQEYFLAMSYEKLGDTVNALAFLDKMLKLKPYHYDFVGKACNILERHGNYQTAVVYLSDYLVKEKSETKPWYYLSTLYEKLNDTSKSLTTIDTALKYLPNDTILKKRKAYLVAIQKQKPYEQQINSALNFYKNADYKNAIKAFTQIINIDTSMRRFYEYRGISYFYLHEYRKCIADLNIILQWKPSAGSFYNIRGICFHYLGNDNEACRDFEMAKQLNDRDAMVNSSKFCKQVKTGGVK